MARFSPLGELDQILELLVRGPARLRIPDVAQRAQPADELNCLAARVALRGPPVSRLVAPDGMLVFHPAATASARHAGEEVLGGAELSLEQRGRAVSTKLILSYAPSSSNSSSPA